MQKILYISSVVLSIAMVCSAMDNRLDLYEQTNSKLNLDSNNFTLAQEMLNTDPRKALSVLDVLVKNNFSPAQHLLADILKQGCYGVEKDEQKALEYYKVAAENNYKKSQFALGLHYLQLAAIPRPLVMQKRHIKGAPLYYSFYNEKIAQKMLNCWENIDKNKKITYEKINSLMQKSSSEEACIIFEHAFLDHITKNVFNSDTIDMFLSSGAYQTLVNIITGHKKNDFARKQAQYVSGSFWYEALRCGLSEDQLNRLNIKYQLVDNNKNKTSLHELYYDKAYTLLKKANNAWAFLCLGEMIHSGYKSRKNKGSAHFFYRAFIHGKADEKKEGLQKLALQYLKELATKGDIEAKSYLNLLPDTRYIVKEVCKESSKEHTAAKIYEVAAYNKPDINFYDDIEEIPCIIVPSYANYAHDTQDYIYNHVVKEVAKESQDSYCAEKIYQVTCKPSQVYEVAYKETGVDLYNKGVYKEAFKYFEASKENQHIACYYLAKMCFEGQGQEKSDEKALFYCGQFFDYVFNNAQQYACAKDTLKKVLKIISAIADNAYSKESGVVAQYYMGISSLNKYLFTNNNSCIKDACRWLLSAEKNYLEGTVEQNSDAETYFINLTNEVLQKSKNGELAYTLGQIYLNRFVSGKVLSDNDLEICKKYILDAEKYGFAKTNVDDKKKMADIYYELGLCAKRANNNTDTEQYFNKALNFNSKHPYILFERGKNKFNASKKCKKEQELEGYSDILFAANSNIGLAQFWLADAFLKGKCDKKGTCKIKQDVSKGIKWLEKAVKSNNLEAILIMADYYRRGFYTIKKDIDKAIHYVNDVQDISFPFTVFLLAVCYYEKALEMSEPIEKELLFIKSHDLFVSLLKTDQAPVASLYLAKMYLSSYGIKDQQKVGLAHLQLFLDKVKIDFDSVRLIHSLNFYEDIHCLSNNECNDNKKANFLCGLIAYYTGLYGNLVNVSEIEQYFVRAERHFDLVSKEEQEYVTLCCYLANIMMFRQVVKQAQLPYDDNFFQAGGKAVDYFLDALNLASKKEVGNEKIKKEIRATVNGLVGNLMAIGQKNSFTKSTIKGLFQRISIALKHINIGLTDVENIILALDAFCK